MSRVESRKLKVERQRRTSFYFLFSIVLLVCPGAQAQDIFNAIQFNGVPTGSCAVNQVAFDYNNGDFYTCKASAWSKVGASSGAVPSGLITLVTSGACGSGWSEVTALNGVTVIGTLAANGDVGATGGSNTITPTVSSTSLTAAAQTVNSLTAAAQTFSGDSTTVPAETISWPANPPTISGSTASESSHTHAAGSLASAWPAGVPTVAWPPGVPSAANESSHTHSVTAAGTNGTVSFTPAGTVSAPTFTGTALATHSHGAGTLADATSGSTVKLFTSSTSGVSAATHSGSTAAVSAGTPAGTNSAPTFSGSAGTVPAEAFTGSAVTSGAGSAHTHTISWPAGVPTNTWPAGTPTISGSVGAGSSHSHGVGTLAAAWPVNVPTNGSVSVTPQGHNAASAVTGTMNSSAVSGSITMNQFDNRPAFVKVIFCKKD